MTGRRSRLAYADLDRDGFLEYRTRSAAGVKNQGWKDSDTAIVDEPPRRGPWCGVHHPKWRAALRAALEADYHAAPVGSS